VCKLLQLVGTLVASSAYFGTSWWLLESVNNICDGSVKGNIWTCPGDEVFYRASIIWGLVGPKRMFGSLGLYQKQNWFFLAGALAPVVVWVLSKKFPNVKFLKHINMPILIGATGNMPPARAVDFICWGTTGFIFNYIIFNRHKKWWSRHNYILSGALDVGLAFWQFCVILHCRWKESQIWGGGEGHQVKIIALLQHAQLLLASRFLVVQFFIKFFLSSSDRLICLCP
jgi:OPT family oligopeptide transporter